MFHSRLKRRFSGFWFALAWLPWAAVGPVGSEILELIRISFGHALLGPTVSTSTLCTFRGINSQTKDRQESAASVVSMFRMFPPEEQ